MRHATAPMLIAALCAACTSGKRFESRPESTPVYPSPAPVPALSGGPLKTLADVQNAAARTNSVVDLPSFERTPAELAASVLVALGEADRRLDALGAQPLDGATFDSTIAAIDDIIYPVITVANRISLMKETQTDPALRAAATEQVDVISAWQVKTAYREDVYRACKAYADALGAGARPAPAGEDRKLFTDTMRDYRRAGLHLPKETRDKVEALQKEILRLSNEFNSNITEARHELRFSKAELAGVPEDFLRQVAQPDGSYTLLANVTPHYVTVSQNAANPEVRRRLETARMSLAMGVNSALLDRIVALRDEAAAALGHASWADYQVEPRMAKTAARAVAFLDDLRAGLEPKFREELAEFGAMKGADTGEKSPTIHSWDWRYYENQLKKRKYEVDAEALRAYFPLDACLAGMFRVYEAIFGLRLHPIDAPYVWFGGVTLWAASDARTGEIMGLFYLDMLPREGKYTHFAQFDIIGGRERPDGRRQAPVVALVCNFNPPVPASGEQPAKPSLLSHSEVETLFHEFGHALHSILTRAHRAQFAGTNVPRDFVEAPSQMLENWVWDAGVLNSFAADYRDPLKKIDPALIERMKEARLATAGVYWRRQAALALGDLRLHLAPTPGAPKSAQKIINETFAEVFIAPPEGTSFGAFWGHLTGYDAGYYGYSWSRAIAEDMASQFAASPDGWMSASVGRRLRDEVYAVGGSREADETIRAFLGRDWTVTPFLTSIGATQR